MQQMSLAERFWRRVNKTGPLQPGMECACWVWTASKNYKGYGRIREKRVDLNASRVSYLLNVGDIPEDMCVLHRCDNPSCVHPSHLFLGTNTDNMRDRDDKGRQAKGVNHGSAKLNDDVVVAIRKDPRGHKLLARQYGVSRTAIRKIRSGETWRHVV